MFKRRWATLLFWLIVFGAIVFVTGPSESFQQCIRDRHDTYPYKAPQEEVSFFFKAIPWVRLQTACGFVSANENNGAITGVAGVIVAIFTFTLWLSTHRLWRAGEEQIKIAKEAADAATKSSKSYKSAERAWVSFSGFESIEVSGSDETGVSATGVEFAIQWKNTGRTPAVNCESWANHKVLTMTDSILDVSFTPDVPESDAIMNIGPGISANGPGRFVRNDVIDSIKNKRFRLVLWGRIKYTDVFDQENVRFEEIIGEIIYGGEMVSVSNGRRVGTRWAYRPINKKRQKKG